MELLVFGNFHFEVTFYRNKAHFFVTKFFFNCIRCLVWIFSFLSIRHLRSTFVCSIGICVSITFIEVVHTNYSSICTRLFLRLSKFTLYVIFSSVFGWDLAKVQQILTFCDTWYEQNTKCNKLIFVIDGFWLSKNKTESDIQKRDLTIHIQLWLRCTIDPYNQLAYCSNSILCC